MKFEVTYSREYKKIIYARNKQEAMWKFNQQVDENLQYVDVKAVNEVKKEKQLK